MKTSKIQNQSYLRKINLTTVLSHLRREKLSCADLAKRMGLSNTAIGNITDEMAQAGLLLREESKNQDVGRRPILLSVNADAAAVPVVELSGRELTVAIADLHGDIRAQKSYPLNGKIDIETLNSLAKMLAQLHRETCPDTKALCLCISTPGKIDKNTGNFLFAHKFENYKEINLKAIFSRHFDCEILVFNDIKLALDGERFYRNVGQDVKNMMLLHVGYSVGSALLLNGSVFSGAHGFAGEISNFLVDSGAQSYDLFKPQHLNTLHSLSVDNLIQSAIASLKSGQTSLLKSIARPDTLTLEDFVKAYELCDTFTVGIFDAYANTWANIIRNLAEFLDLQEIMLSGTITKLSGSFKNRLESIINGSLKYSDIKITYSALKEQAPLYGAVNAAAARTLEILLDRI